MRALEARNPRRGRRLTSVRRGRPSSPRARARGLERFPAKCLPLRRPLGILGMDPHMFPFG
ncbi:hypothetical protein Mnod_1900 [Methylobacterium nodulans ORS 2060]|uniref:Uncharacterized protein n=1 Tax=Methylobacterium nodulans (strain LMG 21967 / CNCM I-2342 / ORS 2060) TaxID=460265 RepID=B8IS77_METNO|nr:hypothetical protein Mnod_1900 [Methylobacterium nodulans ORS 2060]